MGIKKKDPGSFFFVKANSAGLANLLIRHVSKYGNMTSSALAFHQFLTCCVLDSLVNPFPDLVIAFKRQKLHLHRLSNLHADNEEKM